MTDRRTNLDRIAQERSAPTTAIPGVRKAEELTMEGVRVWGQAILAQIDYRDKTLFSTGYSTQRLSSLSVAPVTN